MRYVRATAEDQARIQEFLSQFVDDYLSEQVEQHVRSLNGGIYLALDDDDSIVATAVVTLVKTHEAYLGGMRIRPDVQGTDLGREFAEFQVQEANRLGAIVVRALVNRNNESSQQIFTGQLGFEVVDEWVVGSMEGFDGPHYPDGEAGPAWAVDRDRLESFCRQNEEELWSESGHYMPRTLTFDDVWHAVELGRVGLSPQNTADSIESIALFRIQDSALHLNYMRTMGHHLKALIQYLWVESRAWGVKSMHFGLPRHVAEKLVEVAGLPLSREWHGVVLEKRVGLTSTSSV